MMRRPVYLAGGGSYLPGEPIPFAQIDTILGPLPEAPPRIQNWMQSTSRMMGELLDIRYVHYAMDPITREYIDDNVTMGEKASRRALAAAEMGADEIDLLCYGSPHQDQMPTASVRIQAQLGIEVCQEFSIHANCTSAYKALYLAWELIGSGQNDNALVVSSNISSSELRAEYYNQPLVDKESLFLRWFLSDGAGALVLTADPARSNGFELDLVYCESVGGSKPSLMNNRRPAYWMNPVEEFRQGAHHLRQAFRNSLGSGVFQEPDGSVFFKGFKRMLAKGNIPVAEIRLFQVNMPTKHIINAIIEECATLGIPRQAFYTRLDEMGYCGPPMALICLDRILAEETLLPGDRVVSFVTEVSKFMQAGYALRYVGPT